MRKLRRKDTALAQQDLRQRSREVVAGSHNGFRTWLAALLEKMCFTLPVYPIGAPYYRLESRGGGRPPVDPAGLMWMLIVSFPEGIGSARGIASRCADRLAIRRFLGYRLTGQKPDHSIFTAFRNRWPVEACEVLLAEVLRPLREHGPLRAWRLGIDSSVVGANAVLSGLECRDSEDCYQEYVGGPSADAGVGPSDPAAVARSDRTRAGHRTSNREWHHPHDSDACVGRAKSGACDLINKPEPIVDLESGAVISAEIRHGDEGDSAGLADRIAGAVGKVDAIRGGEYDAVSSRVLALALDKG